jgi:hypothetical protein
MGLLEYRFELVATTPVHTMAHDCVAGVATTAAPGGALRVVLCKRATTARERMHVRSVHVTFGDMDDDAVELAVKTNAPQKGFDTGSPDLDHRTAVLMTQGRIIELADDAERVSNLVDAGRYDDALRHMAIRVADTFLQDGIAHHALYYPRFDTQVARMARVLADRQLPAQPRAMRENHLIIATELYRIGGHSKVIEEIAKELPNPVLVLTDLFGSRASQPDESAWIESQYCTAQVIDLREGTLWQRAAALSEFTSRLQPRSIWYFNHHQDPVPFVATLGLSGPRKILVHHCDHNPSIGASLNGVVHVDITDTLQAECSKYLCQQTELLRLYVADQGVKPFQRVSGTDYSVVTAGRAGKFARDGTLALSSIVATTLATVNGRHYHVGPLDPEWQEEIVLTLRSRGLDPLRFVSLGSVPCLWTTLRNIDAAVYIGSAPVSGGRGAVEAQGCGLPVLPFTGFEPDSLLADFSSYSERDLGWNNLEALAERLYELGDRHELLSSRARSFYEAEFSHTRFARHVRGLAGSAAAAKPKAA